MHWHLHCFADFQFGPQSGWFVECARKNINLDCFDLDRNRLVCGCRAAKFFVVFEFGPRSGSRMWRFGPRSGFSVPCQKSPHITQKISEPKQPTDDRTTWPRSPWVVLTTCQKREKSLGPMSHSCANLQIRAVIQRAIVAGLQ